MGKGTRQCEWCGSGYTPTRRTSRTCSKDCRVRINRRDANARESARRLASRGRERQCEKCGQAYSPPRSDSRYCSSTCSRAASRDRESAQVTLTCEACGADFDTRNKSRVRCDSCCRKGIKQARPPLDRICPCCGEAFTAHSNRAIYCSTACRSWVNAARRKGWRAKKRPPARACLTCGQSTPTLRHAYCCPECKPMRVRDGKVYRHPKERTANCDVCGREFTTRRARQRFCTRRCSDLSVSNLGRYQERLGRRCERCGDPLPETHRLGRRFCTESCQVRFNQEIRRARRRGLPAERISRHEVFERDGWVCALCHEDIDPTLADREPFSASLDHIIPLAYDWSPGHVWGNVQATHLRCNISKRDRIVLDGR